MTANSQPLGIAKSLLAAALGTPCVRLTRLPAAGSGTVYVKWESLSPHLSGYDRVAKALLESQALSAGSTYVEASHVSWCICLAAACVSKGARLHVYLPDDVSQESQQMLRLLKVNLTLTPAVQGLGHAKMLARREGTLVSERHAAVFTEARRATAEELLAHIEAEGGRIDAFVCGAATGGLFTACARALATKHPRALRCVATVESFGAGVDVAAIDAALAPQPMRIALDEARSTRTLLARREGMLVSTEQGAVIAAALRQASALGEQARIFAIVSESGERTLSVDSHA